MSLPPFLAFVFFLLATRHTAFQSLTVSQLHSVGWISSPAHAPFSFLQILMKLVKRLIAGRESACIYMVDIPKNKKKKCSTLFVYFLN